MTRLAWHVGAVQDRGRLALSLLHTGRHSQSLADRFKMHTQGSIPTPKNVRIYGTKSEDSLRSSWFCPEARTPIAYTRLPSAIELALHSLAPASGN